MLIAPNNARPWPVPSSPWIMTQEWHDLLFMHWRVPTSAVRGIVPARLEIDTFDGSAWIGVIPFRMTGIRRRGMPAVPGASAFPELNVRTYVRVGKKAGVWFFSLDAASPIAVSVARRWFHLPYFRAQMSLSHTPGGLIDYRSSRVHHGAPAADLRVLYRPIGAVFHAQPGTIEYFLAERYCLYAAHENRIYRSEIDHALWPLQTAEAHIKLNTMAAASAILLPNEKPLLHFARYQDVKVWPLKEIG